MADIKSKPSPNGVAAAQMPRGLAGVSGRDCLGYVELLFFAYRDFVSDPDAILEEYGFGRAHHRVLHFVNRNPGLRVADLLHILKITKQSLARVLKQLVSQGFIAQRPGRTDRRARLLYTTEQGAHLAARLALPQESRVRAALEAAGPDAAPVIERFLFHMITEGERGHVSDLIAAGAPIEDIVDRVKSQGDNL